MSTENTPKITAQDIQNVFCSGEFFVHCNSQQYCKIAEELNSILQSKSTSAEPVQEWEEFTGEEARKRRYTKKLPLQYRFKQDAEWQDCTLDMVTMSWAYQTFYRRPRRPQQAVKESTIRIEVSSLTPQLRNMLTGAVKWLERIHDRLNDLPASFIDGTDPAPLINEIRIVLHKSQPRGEPVPKGAEVATESSNPAADPSPKGGDGGTPETDSHTGISPGAFVVKADFARQLERQRDTARAELATSKQNEHLQMQRAIKAEAELAKVRGELEETETALDAYMEKHTGLQSQISDLKSQLETSQKEAESLKATIANIREQRDNLRQAQVGGRSMPRVLGFDELVQDGDYYVPRCGGLIKVNAQHFGKQAHNWSVPLVRFESPWHLINLADPTTLPKENDADRNGNVEWLFHDDAIRSHDSNFAFVTNPPRAWRSTNLPPLSSPAPTVDAFEEWMKRRNPSINKESGAWADYEATWIAAQEAFHAGQSEGGNIS